MGNGSSVEGAGQGKAIRPKNLNKLLSSGLRAKKVPTVTHRSGGNALRVGTLTWSQFEDSKQRRVTDEDVARSLELVRERLGQGNDIRADVVLCSGAAMWSDRRANYDVISRELMAAAGGAPVLFEWRDEQGDPASWWLTAHDSMVQIRTCQYIEMANHAKRDGHEVIREIESFYGRIRVADRAELVVILCNEARMLQHTTPKGLFAGVRQRPAQLPEPFNRPWYMLHPSHRPYQNSRQAGVGLVDTWFNPASGRNEEPVFVEATRKNSKYADGSMAPRAIVHAGPFNLRRPNERELATVAFADGRVVAPARPRVNVPGLVDVQYAEFEFVIPGP